MTADLLRRAAAEMRERAAAATPGVWVENVLGSEGYDVRANPDPTGNPIRRIRVARCGYEKWETDRANAEHIASWHPIVAFTVADLLDGSAEAWDLSLAEREDNAAGLAEAYSFEVSVARAYLGEAS